VCFFYFPCIQQLRLGTLGSGKEFHFATSKIKLEQAIDRLIVKYPEYKIPEKWEFLDDWEERGYDFLESETFYFRDSPEEIYYVTYVGNKEMLNDPQNVRIAIRAINQGSQWQIIKNIGESEKGRINKRFAIEIMSKLESILKLTVSPEKTQD
jgi:hypothetical protein